MREPALTGATRAAMPARVNRYEGLARELPRLAAEFAALCSHGEPGSGADAAALVPEAQPPNGVIVPIETARRPSARLSSVEPQ